MKNKTILALVILLIASACVLAIFDKTVKQLKSENTTLESNQAALLLERDFALSESQKYKVRDSLSAAKVTALELSVAQYKKYRAEDLKLISSLNIKKSELEKVINSQTETISSLKTELRDTTIISEHGADTLKSFEYMSEWIDVNGIVNLSKDEVELDIANREALTVVETVQYKRFLGFLWKTKQIKNREVDIVSKNPHTKIIDIDVSSIKQ